MVVPKGSSDCAVIGRCTVTTVLEVLENAVRKIDEVVEPENLLILDDWAVLGEATSSVIE